MLQDEWQSLQIAPLTSRGVCQRFFFDLLDRVVSCWMREVQRPLWLMSLLQSLLNKNKKGVQKMNLFTSFSEIGNRLEILITGKPVLNVLYFQKTQLCEFLITNTTVNIWPQISEF